MLLHAWCTFVHDSCSNLEIAPVAVQLVVVETALNTAHGSAHGNEICRQDCLTFAHAAAPGSHEQVRCTRLSGAGWAGCLCGMGRKCSSLLVPLSCCPTRLCVFSRQAGSTRWPQSAAAHLRGT